MNIEILREEIIPADLAAELDRWSRAIFNEKHGITWSNESEWMVIVTEGGQLVSALELICREVTINGQSTMMGGVGGVMTLPEFRKKGYASAAMRAANEFIQQKMDVPYALLVTGSELIPFYGSLGWQVIKNRVFYWQPDGKRYAFSDQTAIMVYVCGDNPFPEGEIDLNGLPW